LHLPKAKYVQSYWTLIRAKYFPAYLRLQKKTFVQNYWILRGAKDIQSLLQLVKSNYNQICSRTSSMEDTWSYWSPWSKKYLQNILQEHHCTTNVENYRCLRGKKYFQTIPPKHQSAKNFENYWWPHGKKIRQESFVDRARRLWTSLPFRRPPDIGLQAHLGHNMS
jgi:hypothetical protein